eukprot:4634866-Prymnesium_polylepis.2
MSAAVGALIASFNPQSLLHSASFFWSFQRRSHSSVTISLIIASVNSPCTSASGSSSVMGLRRTIARTAIAKTRMHCEWSTSLVPEPDVRSSTSRKTCMLGQISRQRCLISLHTSCPSGHASVAGRVRERTASERRRIFCRAFYQVHSLAESPAQHSRERNKW